MSEFINLAKAWFMDLGTKYGVDPIIFGSIYVGAIPFFTISIAWLIRNYRQNRSIIFPAFSSILFFISAYLYLIIVGRNVPWWVYLLIIVMIGYGVYSTILKIRQKIRDNEINSRDNKNS